MTFIRLLSAWISIGVLLPQSAAAADSLQKVRIGYPSSAVSTLPFDIAKEKGFYIKAGLDVEYIQMRTVIAPQAILNGNIHSLPRLSRLFPRRYPDFLWWLSCRCTGTRLGCW